MMKKIIGLCLLSLMVTSPVFAEKAAVKPVEKTDPVEEVAEPDPADFPVLEKLKGDKKNLSYDYLGHRFGIDAWLLSGPNVMQIVYIPPTSKGAILSGALVGEDGKEASSDLTKTFMTEYPERAQEILTTVNQKTETGPVKEVGTETAKPEEKPAVKTAPTTPSEILWQKMEQGGRISFNDDTSATELYAILDPSQPETKVLWTSLLPLIKDKKIKLHVLPLGLTTADSILEIASVLGSNDAQNAWLSLMKGTSSVTNPTPETNGVLGMKANVDLAQSIGLRELPFLVYRGENGKIRIVKGMPKDWKIFEKELSL